MFYFKESRDDLWFYVGFLVVGLYVYDLVDKDIYLNMIRRVGNRKLVVFLFINILKDNGSCVLFVVGWGRGRWKLFEWNIGSGKERNLDIKVIKEEIIIILIVFSY